MADHTTQIIAVRELSDEQVAYTVRCCGEPMTDSVHTVAINATDRDASLAAHIAAVAQRHQAKLDWRAQDTNAVGTAEILTVDPATGEVTATQSAGVIPIGP